MISACCWVSIALASSILSLPWHRASNTDFSDWGCYTVANSIPQFNQFQDLQAPLAWDILGWSQESWYQDILRQLGTSCGSTGHVRGILVRNCHHDLGLLVTSNLHWNEHYDMLLKKAYKTLGLIRRIFQNTRVVQAKKLLYLTLVCSKLQYCSPIWRPQYINDIKNIENIQRRATKFILNDYSSDYKSRLIKLNLLPLMMQFEFNDIMFFVENLRDPSQSFNVMDFVEFCSGSTRSSTFLKLKQPSTTFMELSTFYGPKWSSECY